MKDKIIESLQRAIGQKDIKLDVPEREEFGEYSSNIAMQAFARAREQESIKVEGKNPRELAEDVVKKLHNDGELMKMVEKVEVAGPGFINFHLKNDVLVSNLKGVLGKGSDYGRSEINKNKKLSFEFGQPNTHKLPHIGHLFSYILGSALSNILEATGYEVQRSNYQGDIGPQVAKCLWAYMKEKPPVPKTLDEKVTLLQKMYQQGSAFYDMGGTEKNEIDRLNQDIYKNTPELQEVLGLTIDWSRAYYKEFEKRLGIAFDRYYFESEVQEKGKDLVRKNIGTIFTESEGAIIFPGSKLGLHDRVFITSKDTPTYEAKDLALEILKYEEFHYDKLIITTASEQNEYFKVVFEAIEKVRPNLKGKLNHIGFGMVNLKDGKMSSRTGDIIGAVELVDLVVSEIENIVSDRKDLNEGEKKEIAEAVGIGAAKYAFLKNSPQQDIKFDIKESISKEGNSGPYLQYTYARTQSVLAKSIRVEEQESGRDVFASEAWQSLDLNSEERTVLRALLYFPEVVEKAADNYAPNLICNYVYDLAQKFNGFYAKHKILENSKKIKAKSELRIALTEATGVLIQNALNLLGIKTLQRM